MFFGAYVTPDYFFNGQKPIVRVKRLSETEDFIPIVVSASLIGRKWFKKSLKGKWVGITGQFRSYNKIGKDGRQHLDLFLFVGVKI